MECKVVVRGEETYSADSCVMLGVFEDGESTFGTLVKDRVRTALRKLFAEKRISGKAKSTYFFPALRAPYAGVVVLGLGKRAAFNAEVLRRASAASSDTLRAQRIRHIVFDATGGGAFPVEAAIEGIMLGQYDYVSYKKPSDDPPVNVSDISIVVDAEVDVADLGRACANTTAICANANWARNLGCMAPNDLVPSALAAHAEAMGKAVGADTAVMDADEMRLLGMNAILGVARGSSKSPKLIRLHYSHPDAKETLALVGKGVTFDTGGISLKPGLNMHEMKYDMCGAAAVLGAFKSVCELRPTINVVCVVPAAENKPGADAQRPGDIIKAYNGKTIEVHNTDAEGRMLLADALSYTAERYRPAAMVDVATLTGAIIVGLGHFAAGVMATDHNLLAELQLASDATGERIWPMPLWDDYAELIKGTHADLCNIGPQGQAGAVVAGCFLKEFTGGVPWAHLDIAGTAWGVNNIPYWNSKHATGYGVRLLTQWVLDEAAHRA